MLRLFRPTVHVPVITSIDVAALAASGIKGMIFDLDDTLVPPGVPLIDEIVGDWLREAMRHVKVCIVSNNRNLARVTKAAEPFAIPCYVRAQKPRRRSIREAIAAMELPPDAVCLVGDRLLTDVVGGNRMGVRTILVDPVDAPASPKVFHVIRALERRLLLRLVGGAVEPAP